MWWLEKFLRSTASNSQNIVKIARVESYVICLCCRLWLFPIVVVLSLAKSCGEEEEEGEDEGGEEEGGSDDPAASINVCTDSEGLACVLIVLVKPEVTTVHFQQLFEIPVLTACLKLQDIIIMIYLVWYNICLFCWYCSYLKVKNLVTVYCWRCFILVQIRIQNEKPMSFWTDKNGLLWLHHP